MLLGFSGNTCSAQINATSANKCFWLCKDIFKNSGSFSIVGFLLKGSPRWPCPCPCHCLCSSTPACPCPSLSWSSRQQRSAMIWTKMWDTARLQLKYEEKDSVETFKRNFQMITCYLACHPPHSKSQWPDHNTLFKSLSKATMKDTKWNFILCKYYF